MSDQQPSVPSAAASGRAEMRKALLTRRKAWFTSPAAPPQLLHIAATVSQVLQQLEPECLGLYWPLDAEFNAVECWRTDPALRDLAVALPFAFKADRQMAFRRWDGRDPSLKDECGIPSCDGAAVTPDVVLVPCLGHTREAYRLGYGGGYFDRWLAAHPEVTAVGVGWGGGEVQLEVQAHDVPMALIITEQGVVA